MHINSSFSLKERIWLSRPLPSIDLHVYGLLNLQLSPVTYTAHFPCLSTDVSSCILLCGMDIPSILLAKDHMEKQHDSKFLGMFEVKSRANEIQSYLCKRHITPESDSTPKKKQFRWEECGQKFKRRSHFFSHVKAHSSRDGSFKLSCPHRGKGFQLVRHFQARVKEHDLELEKTFDCNVNECGKKYTSKPARKKHIRRAHMAKRPYLCSDCGKSFPQSRSYRNHMRIHAAAKSYLCDVCGKGFNVSDYLRLHMLTHKEEKKYQCKRCGKAFSHYNSLRSHSRVHTGEKPFACEECGRKFTNRENFRAHQTWHTGIRPYKCNECGKAYYARRILKSHMKKHTQGIQRRPRSNCEDKPFKCHECGRPFLHSASLKVHVIKKHSGKVECSKGIAMRSECDICGKSFASSYYRDAHKKVHTGETPFKCAQCTRAFASKVSLQLHERTHTGEKPFVCHVCDRGFSFSTNLSRHMRIHNGEKPFVCDICGKAFTQLNSLTQHRRTHTGEKPYKCDLCGQAFCENRGLKKHRQRVHNS